MNVATVVILREDGAVLLQHRDDKPGLPRANMWVIPGGHVEPGEAIRDAAIREVMEETNYECEEIQFLDRFDDVNDITGASYYLHVFWCHYIEGQEIRCFEGQELRFVSRTEAEKYIIPGVVLDAWDRVLAIAGEQITVTRY